MAAPLILMGLAGALGLAVLGTKRRKPLEVGVPYRIEAAYPADLSDEDLTALVEVLEAAQASQVFLDWEAGRVFYVVTPWAAGWDGVPEGLPLRIITADRMS